MTRPGEHTCNLQIQEMEAGEPSSRTSLATQRLKPRLHESMSQTVTAKEGAKRQQSPILISGINLMQ